MGVLFKVEALITMAKSRSGKKLNISGLSKEQLELLQVIRNIGAATPVELEISTGRIGQDNMSQDLSELHRGGLVEPYTSKFDSNTKIYTLSKDARNSSII